LRDLGDLELAKQERTLENVARNPHIKYGRSDKRGYMWMEVTPNRTTTSFMGLDNVRDPKSDVKTLASFDVENGAPGVRQKS
jgi:alkaline phosphatase D